MEISVWSADSDYECQALDLQPDRGRKGVHEEHACWGFLYMGE